MNINTTTNQILGEELSKIYSHMYNYNPNYLLIDSLHNSTLMNPSKLNILVYKDNKYNYFADTLKPDKYFLTYQYLLCDSLFINGDSKYFGYYLKVKPLVSHLYNYFYDINEMFYTDEFKEAIKNVNINEKIDIDFCKKYHEVTHTYSYKSLVEKFIRENEVDNSTISTSIPKLSIFYLEKPSKEYLKSRGLPFPKHLYYFFKRNDPMLAAEILMDSFDKNHIFIM